MAIDSPTTVAGAHGIFGKQDVEPLPDLAVRCRVDVVGRKNPIWTVVSAVMRCYTPYY